MLREQNIVFTFFLKVPVAALLVLALLSVFQQAHAIMDTTASSHADYRFKVHASVYTTHFNPKPEHNNTQNLLGAEWYGKHLPVQPWQDSRTWLNQAAPLVGAAWFRNSYNQRTLYAYTGIRQDLQHYDNGVQSYAKLTAGFLHGYQDKYRDRVPMNQMGTSPAIVPMFGLQYQSAHIELVLFGASGLMLNIGRSF